jgi:hypothetical protein
MEKTDTVPAKVCFDDGKCLFDGVIVRGIGQKVLNTTA